MSFSLFEIIFALRMRRGGGIGFDAAERRGPSHPPVPGRGRASVFAVMTDGRKRLMVCSVQPYG